MYCTFHFDITSNILPEEWCSFPFKCLHPDIQDYYNDCAREYGFECYPKSVTIHQGFYLFIQITMEDGTTHRIDVHY
jgi:hypothetical protein